MRAGILLCLTLFLAACSPNIIREPIEVVRTEYKPVAVPAALLEAELCPTEKVLEGPPRATYGEAVAAWKACLEAVRRANAKLAEISNLTVESDHGKEEGT